MAELATERMVVSASPARCFEVSADLASYPSWAADIKSVTIDERDAEGPMQSGRHPSHLCVGYAVWRRVGNALHRVGEVARAAG